MKIKKIFVIKDVLWIVLLSTILLSFDYFCYSGTDYGVYFNNGRLITKGMLPYVDFWDHKTPGIYFYLALWQLIFGSSYLSAKISLMPIYVLWGISIYSFCYVLFRNRKLALVTSLIGLYFSLRMGFDASRNGAILILSTSIELIALAIIYYIFRNKVNNVPLYIITGLLGFGAFFTRQTSITPFIITAVILVSFLFSRKDPRRIYFSMYCFVGVLIFFLFVVGLLLKFQIPISEIYRDIIYYNQLYVDFYRIDSFWLSWQINILLDYFWWMTILVIGIVFIIVEKKSNIGNSKLNKSALFYVLICLGIALLLTVSSVHVQPYYKIQYSPYLIISACYLLHIFLEEFQNEKIKKVIFSTIVIVGLIPYIFLITVTDVFSIRSHFLFAKESNYSLQNFPDQIVAKEVRVLSSSDEPDIFIFGNRSWIYLLSNSTNVNKYYYSNSIFRNRYLSENEFKYFLQGMEDTPPEVMIIWPNRPLITEELYNAEYILRFENYIKNNYSLVNEYNYENIEQLNESIKIFKLDTK